MRFRLHHVIFLALALISLVPVSMLAIWVQRHETATGLENAKEMQAVMAGSMSGAIARYVADLESVFDMVSTQASSGQEVAGVRDLLARMNIQHLCVIDKDHVIRFWLALDGKMLQGRIRQTMVDHLDPHLKAAAADPAEVYFSHAANDYAGRPTIWMVRSLSDGRFALAGVSMEFLTQLGRQIGFGKGGHAAIVDARGRVLWHPKEDWRKEIKDLSAVRPVKAMLERQSGAMTFFSPATQSEMVVGYSIVPRTGWGVMVPMPMAEIEARAAAFGRAAWFVALLGLAAALVASWFVARYLARPIREVASAANNLASGRLDARVPVHAHPTELRELGTTFNAMADEVAAKNIALSEAVGRAEAASRTKSDFLANVSHEVRTPLNAIIGFAELMRTAIYGPLGHPKYLGYAENIHASASHLLGLVNSVLDLSKAESGTLDVALEAVDVTATIDACLPMIELQAKAAGVRIERQHAQHLPLGHADTSRLKQVLINLLSNAVKFTPAGGVVNVESERTDAGGIRVRVRDTGVGIAAEDIPQILSPFGRAEKPWLRNNSGAGLGLPLSRRIMIAMGGTLSLASTPGLGTVATVEIAPAVANTLDARPLAAQ